MKLKAVEQYYVELRKYNFDNNIPIENIKIRRKIHRLLLYIIKLDRIISKEDLYLISDERIKSSTSKIYACTHIGGNDIQRTFEAIQDHAYLFLGDPKEIYRNITGLLLYLNGAIYLETNNKNDRHIAYERSLELLSNGGNLLIYPEGAWNITENLPVTKLYLGAARMASETGADIIPVAIEQYNNKFYVNIGKNIIYKSNYSKNINQVNDDLRNQLATLKWNIWENNGITERSIITDEYKENYKQSIVNKCGYEFTIQDVLDMMYHDNTITNPEDAYIISPKTLFDLNKKYNK